MSARSTEIEVRRERPRCPYCHQSVAGDELKHGCARCMAWHHAACWEESRGACAACGFAEGSGGSIAERGRFPLDRQLRDIGKIAREVPGELRRWDWAGVLASLLTIVLFVPSFLWEAGVRAWRLLRGDDGGPPARRPPPPADKERDATHGDA